MLRRTPSPTALRSRGGGGTTGPGPRTGPWGESPRSRGVARRREPVSSPRRPNGNHDVRGAPLSSARRIPAVPLVALALLASTGAVVAGPLPDAVAAKARAAAVVLKKGARGTAVVIVQRRLGLYADGVFGRQTKRAVKRFQRRHGLLADGEVGPATAAALGITLPASKRSSRRARRPPAVPMTPD